MTFVETTTPVHNFVHYWELGTTLTGVFADGVDGWRYDKRLLEDRDRYPTYHNTYVGGHSYGLQLGTIITHWQSGSIVGTEVREVSFRRELNSTVWTPKVHTGRYSIHSAAKTLFSDYSVAGIAEEISYQLDSDARPDTLEISIYRRNSDLLVYPWRPYTYVDEFSEADGGLNTRLNEFTVSDRVVQFNQVAEKVVGRAGIYTPLNALTETWENKGDANPEGRWIFTNYFPVKPYSFDVVSINPSTLVVTHYQEVDSLALSGPTDKHYAVEYDLGIIQMGGFQAADTTLQQYLDEFENTVHIHGDDSILNDYPERGVVVVESEQIYYSKRLRGRLLNCIRGYNGTTAATHETGVTVSDIQHGYGTPESEMILIAYTAVPRVEYEVTESDIRTANANGPLNVSPFATNEASGVIQLSSVEPNLAEVTLEVDRELIGSGYYGPLLFGTDTARLTATGYSSMGIPVSGIELTIEKLSGPGGLNGLLSSYSDLSNPDGQIASFYNAPFSESDVSQVVESVVHNGSDTLMAVDGLPPGLNPEDVTVFQVLKHDPSSGTVGKYIDASTLDTASVALSTMWPDGSSRAECTLTFSAWGGASPVDEFEGGTISLLFSDGTRYTRTIRDVVVDVDGTTGLPLNYEIDLIDGLPASVLALTIDGIWLVEPDAEVYSDSTLNGVRVLLYEWSATTPHPLTDTPGAYTPLRPTSVTSDGQMLFEGRNLPIPDTDVSNNLGGYLIVSSSIAEFEASGVDPVSGQVVVSDPIKIRLDLPNYLQGVDSSGVLPVPYGFGFVTEDFNVGAGIGGANFITVNPQADGISAFNLKLETL